MSQFWIILRHVLSPGISLAILIASPSQRHFEEKKMKFVGLLMAWHRTAPSTGTGMGKFWSHVYERDRNLEG